ncbi:arrestin-related trafficking adapter 3/6 [Geosmithia morbida]|uniref:Arrestin-related trafficking adapter 3/6 n=1 Tax=Geosmithia morbida TaxID=1094350 RepID=A0A9P4YQ83_9HYPO|nr:arrestin-related trafficking adapter 3/6 [Geosmithia morbida]KAF4119784.1 arrestin-related trafficking adapter 3/6 [Geosmithia morbida]
MPANHRDSPCQSNSWITAHSGNVFYRASNRSKRKSSSTTAQFPRPLIEPRRTRPHSIHIVTYPPGYVPPELRPRPGQSSRSRSFKVRAVKAKRRISNARDSSSPQSQLPRQPSDQPPQQPSQQPSDRPPQRPSEQPVGRSFGEPSDRSLNDTRPSLGKIWASFSNHNSHKSSDRRHSIPTLLEAPVIDRSPATGVPSMTSPGHRASQASDTATPTTDTQPQTPQTPSHTQSQSAIQRSLSLISRRRPSHTPPTTDDNPSTNSTSASATATASATASATNLGDRPASSDTRAPPAASAAPAAPATATATAPTTGSTPTSAAPQPQLRPRPNGISLAAKRNSLMSIRTGKPSLSTHVSETPKSLASGGGISCSIILAEPNVFLSGFDHDGHARRETRAGTALLRGKLQLNVTKNVKLKAVQLELVGRARTEWPEGIPPLKQDVYEEQSLANQVLTFFNAMNDRWETEYGNQCTYKLKDPPEPSRSAATYLVLDPLPPSARMSLTSRDLKRLSLQSAQSRSFGKDADANTTSTQAKGFKIFHPGRYDYSFELPIDHHQLETTKLQYGSVRWELRATVDRAGAFKPNLHGSLEVPIVRIPDQMSLEMSEPISISRQWEDQLHYDIVISGKSFPIGGKIPIAFKLTPLAKVQVHKLKVFATETVEYWTKDRRVTRKDPGRKVLLLEKSAGKPLDSAWASSDLRTVRGGELSSGERHEARELAARRRAHEAARGQQAPQPLPPPSDNILGDLDLGLESYWGSTEIEANVQIPTCEMMAKSKELRLHPDCSWKNINVYHWLKMKIVMRISRQDPGDPTGTKRRHFEISIDSPFTVLNCRATQANTVLPAYTGNQTQGQMYQSSCGCPDATSVPAGASPSSSTGTLSGAEGRGVEALPSLPQAAHLPGATANPANRARNNAATNEPRPIHLLRTPSFNPPAFDDDIAPPRHQEDATQAPLMTPPPQYDAIIGTPSVDGMADYFSRLAEHGYGNIEDDSSSDSDETPPRILERSGRVNVVHPRTPGGRMQSRSMEINRPMIDLHLDRPPTNQTPAAR